MKVQEEREAAREEKAGYEEQQAERELRAERELPRTRPHANVLLSGGGSDQERQDLEDKIAEIDGRIAENDYRTANIVPAMYIISNVGRSGPALWRLTNEAPRAYGSSRELGDASVPFGFDVHTLFSQPDAVSVKQSPSPLRPHPRQQSESQARGTSTPRQPRSRPR
jgi:hypothetical protein